jgi:hypothetical protein
MDLPQVSPYVQARAGMRVPGLGTVLVRGTDGVHHHLKGAGATL